MSGIFEAYDIRGLAPQQVSPEMARKIGYAFAQYLGKGHIVIGRDMRETSSALAEAFAQGALDFGTRVSDIGMSTTPMLYYAIIDQGFDGGAMITASHLPKKYNGIKLCRKKAIPLSGTDGLPEVEVLTRNSGRFPKEDGEVAKLDFIDRYVQALSAFISGEEALKVVVDAGNGMGGLDTPHLIPDFKSCEFITMYMQPDGEFPNHIPNPAIPSTTEALQARVRQEAADLGVAFDGDGDRCGFIDENGDRIPSDLIIAVLAEYFLAREPGATILYDLRSSRAVPERIRELGGQALKTRVGHSFIKEKMRKVSALFAGELSGHYYFQEMGYIDCGILAMISMLNLLGQKKVPLSELVKPLQKYARSGELNFSIDDPDKLFEALEKTFKDGEQDHLDGLTVEYGDWWFNLRKSHTEPVVRLVIEAQDKDSLERHKAKLTGIISDEGGEAQSSDG
jgi:phosphomannomutase